jgi:hypothetical protein
VDETPNAQLLMHDAASLCGVALLRAASRAEGHLEPIIGTQMDRDRLLEDLRSALDVVWPDRPPDVTDLEAFLREAYRRFVSRADALAGEDGFVPAARWREQARDLLLEHLQAEIEALVGGVRTEGFWHSFGAVSDIEQLGELVAAGMLIKLRSVGAFLVLPPSRYEDELTAAAFFSAGKWDQARDEAIAERIARNQKLTHKQIAHLTLTRPLPEETSVYRASTYLYLVQDVLTLLEQFTAAVDPRLLPDRWPEWLGGVRPRLLE